MRPRTVLLVAGALLASVTACTPGGLDEHDPRAVAAAYITAYDQGDRVTTCRLETVLRRNRLTPQQCAEALSSRQPRGWFTEVKAVEDGTISPGTTAVLVDAAQKDKSKELWREVVFVDRQDDGTWRVNGTHGVDELDRAEHNDPLGVYAGVKR